MVTEKIYVFVAQEIPGKKCWKNNGCNRDQRPCNSAMCMGSCQNAINQTQNIFENTSKWAKLRPINLENWTGT